jgi:serine phosphatase RsbU (regulator of sigma subunit)
MSGSTEPSKLKPRLLLADEHAQRSAAIADRLQAGGWPGLQCNVHAAGSLAEALELCGAWSFDGALLSQTLADGRGLRGMERLRERLPWLPIILLAHGGEDGSASAALQAGACDVLGPEDFSAGALCRSVRLALERRLRLTAETQLRAAQAQVAAAEVIQHRLLPRHAPQLRGFDIAGACLPAETIGGDLFDYLVHDEFRCLGVVADVSGHGLPAAILMTELHGLLHGLVEENFDLVRIAEAANRRVLEAAQSYQFITMLLFEANAQSRQFSFVAAGHPGWLLRDGKAREFESRQPPLGVEVDQRRFQLQSVDLAPGDILVLPTDGVFETRGELNDIFGVERMLNLIQGEAHRPAREIVAAVAASVADFVNGPRTADDCTLVIIKVE